MPPSAMKQFFSGFLSLAQGLSLFRRAPEVRRLLWWTFGAFVVVLTLSQVFFSSLVFMKANDLAAVTTSWLPEAGLLTQFGGWALAIVFLIVGWGLNLLLAWAILRLLLTFLLGLLAEKILKHHGRATPGAEQIFRILVMGLKRSLILLLISAPFALALLIPGLNLVAATVFALILAADQMDFAMEALGWTLTERWLFLRRFAPAWLGLAAQLLTLSFIPFIGLMLLPFTVAGATTLVHRLSSEKPTLP